MGIRSLNTRPFKSLPCLQLEYPGSLVLTSRSVLAVADFAGAFSGPRAARPVMRAVGFLDAFSKVAGGGAGGVVRDISSAALAVGGTSGGILPAAHEQCDYPQQTSGKSKAKHLQERRSGRRSLTITLGTRMQLSSSEPTKCESDAASKTLRTVLHSLEASNRLNGCCIT